MKREMFCFPHERIFDETGFELFKIYTKSYM